MSKHTMARRKGYFVIYRSLYDLDISVDKHNEELIFSWIYKMVIRLYLTKMGYDEWIDIDVYTSSIHICIRNETKKME